MTTAATVEEHLDPAAAAARLSVSVSTIRRAVRLGRRTAGRRWIWPVRRLSRQLLLIPASSIARWLERATP